MRPVRTKRAAQDRWIDDFLTSDNVLMVTVQTAVPTETPPFEFPLGELDPISARQAVLASLGRKSISATDISAFALEASKLAARACEVECYGVAKNGAGKGLLFRFGQITPKSQPVAAEEHELPLAKQDSMSGFAQSIGRPITVVDLKSEKRFVDRVLKRLRVKSAIVCPLMHSSGPLGTIGVYSTRQHSFSAADIFFLESVANLVSISLARRTAEKMVAVQNKRFEALVGSSDTPTLELTPEGKITHCNPALERASGFSFDEIEGRSFYSAFVIPEELDGVKRVLSTALRDQECARRECFLLTKSGVRRRMIWSVTCVVDEDGIVTSLIGTAVDITDQHAMNERVKRAEAMADNAVQSMRSLRAQAADVTNSTANTSTLLGDRRQDERLPFPYKQVIAPVVNGQLPSRDAFRAVRCRDLSAQGFSFQADQIPDYQHLLVAFGKQGKLVYVMAQIIHVSPLTLDGKDVFLVGCQYKGRTTLSE